jgi:hypothetical protein
MYCTVYVQKSAQVGTSRHLSSTAENVATVYFQKCPPPFPDITRGPRLLPHLWRLPRRRPQPHRAAQATTPATRPSPAPPAPRGPRRRTSFVLAEHPELRRGDQEEMDPLFVQSVRLGRYGRRRSLARVARPSLPSPAPQNSS